MNDSYAFANNSDDYIEVLPPSCFRVSLGQCSKRLRSLLLAMRPLLGKFIDANPE